MEDKITIENISARQLEKLYQIEKQCFNQEAFSKQQISYLLSDYNAISYAAYVNGELAGFIIGRIDVERNQIAGHILTIDVVPKHRRKGIAQKLIAEIENTAKQHGATECRLEVREDNTSALNLYHKIGYEKIAKLENYYQTAHGFYLKKSLT